MHVRFRWTLLLTLVAVSLVAAPLAVTAADFSGPNPLTIRSGKVDRNQSDGSGTMSRPVVTYERNNEPVMEGLGLSGRNIALSGNAWIATASGYINIAAIGEGPLYFAAMLDTPISATDVALVHFGSMPMDSVRNALQMANITPLGEVPNNALVVTGIDEVAAATLARLGVQMFAWTPGIFVSPEIGITPVFSAEMAANPNLSMQASIFPGTDSAPVISSLEAMGASVDNVINGVVSFQIDIDDLRNGLGTLTGLSIRSLGERAFMYSTDEDTNSGVEIGKFRGGDRPYTEAGINGSGQIIGITDTGLSLDTAVFANGVGDPGTPGPGHRKVAAYVTANGFGGVGDLLTCDGVSGATHGHVVASIAAGNASPIIPDIRVVSGFEPALGGTRTAAGVNGMATLAKVYFVDDQVIGQCSDPEQIEAQSPGSLSANAGGSQAAGARIHNFSFAAAGSEASYTLDSQDLDTFLEANTSFLVVAAAGNSGTDSSSDGNLDFGTVTAPGTAKNVLTVGSSGYPNNALDVSVSVEPNVENNGIGIISRFTSGGNGSGQGPAAFTQNAAGGPNWRMKPDVMAPGDETLGNQRLTSPTSCMSQDDDQTGAVDCSRLTPGIFEGTSFSAAAATGAAAKVRDYFAQGFAPAGEVGGAPVDISGIELKAALIASADLMTGNPAWRTQGGQLQLAFYTPKHLSTFSPEQGYGRIQLNKALPLSSEPGSPTYLHSEVLAVPLAGSVVRTFDVVNADEEARCVASWYDKEATLAGGGEAGTLVRNVNMVVKECGAACGDAGDVLYNGNFFTEDTNFDGALLNLDATFSCSNDPGISCTPGGGFDPVVECGDAAATCDLATPAITEDCNSSGTLDFSEYSLPVSSPMNCPGDGVDVNNGNEAVFLSTAQLGQGDKVEVTVSWPTSTEGVPPGSLDVALVCTGGIAAVGTPDAVRVNKGRYTCSDVMEVTAIAPGGSTDAAVGAAVTVTSYEADGFTVLDTEAGLSFTSSDPNVFNSLQMAVVDAATNPPAADDLVLAVVSGGSIEASFGGNAHAEASVRCTPQLGTNAIVRRGLNANYGISGGCEPLGRIDPRTIIQSAIPGTGTFVTGDLFLDANEDLVYSMGFTNQEEGDPLLDVEASLKACVAGSILGDGSCTTAGGITIYDAVQSLGSMPSGKTQLASFNIHVDAAVAFPADQVELVFGVKAAKNGLTLDNTTVVAHILNQDRWSYPNEDPADSGVFAYSTDYPAGGREVRVYAGEFFDPANPKFAAEEFLFQDLTDGAFGGGSATVLGFNAVTEKFDTPVANTMPWTFDLDDEAFGARRRFDSDPGDNIELQSANVWQWANSGECGFQSNDSTQDDWDISSVCSNAAIACDPQTYDPLADCGDAAATCDPVNRGSGGSWHTGHSESMPGTPPGRTGYDLGCEDYDLPGSADPKRERVIDTVSSPIFFRVHQNPDSNGFAFNVEFTRMGFNDQWDIGDGNVISGYEIDPDTTTAQPVDPLDFGWLASDQGTTGFLSGITQQAYGVFNPNDPQEGTSITVTPGGALDDSGTATNNILSIQGPGSPGPFYESGNSNKAPARQFGEVQGLLTGRGITSGTRRGAGGFPIRNYDNDLRESFQLSFEDVYGANETADPDQTYPITAGNPELLANQRNSFQANFTMILRENPDASEPAVPSYGLGFDDVVVEWRESHPVEDRTPCSDPSTWAVDYTTDQPLGGPTTCIDGPNTGLDCSSDADCGGGSCSSSLASGCAQISWDRTSILAPEDTLTLTVIDSNAQFGPDGIAGTGDEQAVDSNNDGFAEVTVPVSSDADLVGEQLVLTQIALASPVYSGSIAVSSTKGKTSNEDGTIFIQENGDGSNPTTVSAQYVDQDINVPGAGLPPVPCPDNALIANALTQFVGTDIAFVTATIVDSGANSDDDFIADPGETIDMGLTMINNSLDVVRGKPDVNDVTITLVANVLDVGPNRPISCILDGESFMGDLLSGIPKSTDPGDPLRWVVGDVTRNSLGQTLQARFSLGISGRFTDTLGVERVVTSFATPQEFGINLALNVEDGGGAPVATDSVCVGGSESGQPCALDADCPGQRFDAEGGGTRAATCDPLPAYLQAGGSSVIAGNVGYFEGYEGAANMAGRTPSFDAATMDGTSFTHSPAVFAGTGGYLEQFVRDTLGRGVLEGLTVGSTPGGAPDDPQGSSAVDGTRCQFNDIQGPGKWANSEFFCRPWAGSDWHINDNKAFNGTKSMYAGMNGDEDLGADISFDGNHTNALQAAFSGTFNVGVSGGATLSVAHIAAGADDRTFNVPAGNAVGRGYIEWAEVDPGNGTELGAWNKVNGFQNNYGNTGVVAFFSNCVFSNYDEAYDAQAALGTTPGFDINAANVVGVLYNSDGVGSEDDYFDPNDPLRLYGASGGCFPQFVFSSLGDYTSSNTAAVGQAFTEGELGETGTGVWIKSLFSLDEAAGRTIKLRMVWTDIDISPGLGWYDIFGNGLGNATRGWRADDFAVSGLVDAPIVLAIDSRGVVFPDACPIDPNPGIPGNENACNVVTASAGNDVLTPVSGSTVVLDAAASTADSCVNGHLEYQWDIGGQIIQAFSTKSSLVDAPVLTTAYNVVVRCSTDNACSDTDTALVVPGDQLESSGLPTELLDVGLPSGDSALVLADGPTVGGPCDIYLMDIPVAGLGGTALRVQPASSSAADLAAVVRSNSCTETQMVLNGGSGRYESNPVDPVGAVGDIQGYMANALCGGVVGSLGRVKEGSGGVEGSRGRLNPLTPGLACP